MNSIRVDGLHAYLKKWATSAASSADDVADAGLRRLRRRFGREGIPKIQAYTGYSTADSIWIHGRVLTNPPINLDMSHDEWWVTLSSSVRRFASDEVPGINVTARVGNQSGMSTSDAEGYFTIELPRSTDFPAAPFWTTGQLFISDHSGLGERSSTVYCKILNTGSDATYGVISDVDDTILHTGATDISTMVKLTFFGNARTRAPLPGVAMLYELMQRAGSLDNGPVNPIFYVSSSPWNLYDLLDDFLEINSIPDGPMLLRDLGFDRNKFLKEGHDHKLDKTRDLIQQFPGLQFVLFGDSGQEDARLYAKAATEFPDRIRCVFIRDIDPMTSSEHDEKVDRYVQRATTVGVPMFLVRDSDEAARIAVSHGLLSETTLKLIADATELDSRRSRSPF